jgi:high-affinity K+ transport system ATPase subunit B
MNAIVHIVRGLLGLFFADAAIVFGVLAVVGLTAVLIDVVGVAPLAAGGVLLLGNLLALVAGTLRAKTPSQ